MHYYSILEMNFNLILEMNYYSILEMNFNLILEMNYYSILEINHNQIPFCKLNDVLKSPIFNSQRLALHQNGVEFRQQLIGAIRTSLSTSHNVLQRRATSPNRK